jgi:gliding motility-associated-like protein
MHLYIFIRSLVVLSLFTSGFPESKKPNIVGQNPVSTLEDNSRAIVASDLIVEYDGDGEVNPSVEVFEGTNYSVDGAVVIPLTNYNGPLLIPVRVVNDGEKSDKFDLQMDVMADNDPPVIVGQSSIQTNEEQPITLSLSDLSVTDPDNNFPDDFTMSIGQGENYIVSGNTITPNENFSGTLSVPVTVNDGENDSAPFNVQIAVAGVDDKPQITGQQPLSLNEDTSLDFQKAFLTVSDPDNSYPADFTLAILAGPNYSVAGTVITPDAEFSGVLTVGVAVNDGLLSSDSFYASIMVTAVNDKPVITGQNSLQTMEDTPLAISFQDVYVNDPDNVYPNGFSLTIQNGSNYSVSGNTIIPATNFTGTLNAPVTVNDGTQESDPYVLQVTVGDANDSPVITGQNLISINEDESHTIVFSDLLVSDPDNTYPTGFTITAYENASYTVSGTTVTPTLNFYGTLVVSVSVNDGMSESNRYDLQISVAPINDSPIITGQTQVATSEEQPIEIVLSQLIVSDPDNQYPSGFSMSVSSGENYALNGNTVIPALNFSGVLSVPVVVNDGSASSSVFSLQVTVNGTNDAPVIVSQTQVQTNEDQPFTIEFTNLNVTDPDNNYPQGFGIAISPGQNYSVSDRTIQPSQNFSGTLTIPLFVNDGNTNSNTFNFQLTVIAVNDAPVITGQAQLSMYKNTGFKIELSHLTVADPDNIYPNGFVLHVAPGLNYTVAETTITPATDFVGILSVPVSVNDGAGESAQFSLQVSVVKPPNVRPVITSQAKLTTYENKSLQLSLSNLVVNDPDNIYPNDFTLKVFAGAHYVVNHDVIIPEKDYSGQLSVPVTVSDLESSSDVFNLVVDILPTSDVPLITSQKFLKVNEDDSLTIAFSDLIVSDPDNNYPEGFTLDAFDGESFSLSGLKVKPDRNFNGYLSVPVSVNDGMNTSALYQLLIFVDAVNDAPIVSESKTEDLHFTPGNGSAVAFESLVVSDVDDDTLTMAEIAFAPAGYEIGADTLTFENTADIRGIFDDANGLLLLFGKTSVTAYQNAMRTIRYDYSSSVSIKTTKQLGITVGDGKSNSDAYQKVIILDDGSTVLDIPGGFTPNGDGSNDTWGVKLAGGNSSVDVTIKIYNANGTLVHESKGLESEWDGRVGGTLLPAASYFYTIFVKSMQAGKRYSGTVTILR